MGLFRFFAREKQTPQEAEFVEVFCKRMGLSGMPRKEALEMATSILTESKTSGTTIGAFCSLRDDGDRLLELDGADASVREYLARRRADGVTDADFRDWWDEPEYWRRAIMLEDESARLAAYRMLRTQPLSPECGPLDAVTAYRVIARDFAIYGEPLPNPTYLGEDRPLAWELKQRLVRYRLEKKEQVWQVAGETELSANAIIRQAIRDGRV